MNEFSSTASASAPKPLAKRIEFALDYLTQLRRKHQEHLRLPDDNPWREGARETIDLLTPAITLLQDALKLARAHRPSTSARTAQPSDANLSEWMSPNPARELICQGRDQYLDMYWETSRRFDSDLQPIPYDVDRNRTKNIARLLVNTCNRIMYWEDVL